jgi:hypothetical protein
LTEQKKTKNREFRAKRPEVTNGIKSYIELKNYVEFQIGTKNTVILWRGHLLILKPAGHGWSI